MNGPVRQQRKKRGNAADNPERGDVLKSGRQTRCGRKRHFRCRRDTARKPGSHTAGTGKTGASSLAEPDCPTGISGFGQCTNRNGKVCPAWKKRTGQSGTNIRNPAGVCRKAGKPGCLTDRPRPPAHVLACVEQKTAFLPFRPQVEGFSACRLPALAGMPRHRQS